MSREWVDDMKPAPRRGPDTRDRRWVMRCDCWHTDHGTDKKGRVLRCKTEGEPSVEQPPLEGYATEGWFIANLEGDRCPACLSLGHEPTSAPHPLMVRRTA
jgi:hypothetical protein